MAADRDHIGQARWEPYAFKAGVIAGVPAGCHADNTACLQEIDPGPHRRARSIPGPTHVHGPNHITGIVQIDQLSER